MLSKNVHVSPSISVLTISFSLHREKKALAVSMVNAF